MKSHLRLLLLSLITPTCVIWADDQTSVARHISRVGLDVDVPSAEWLVPSKDSPLTKEPSIVVFDGLAWVFIERLPGSFAEDRVSYFLKHIHDSTIHQTDLKKEQLSKLDSIEGKGIRYIVSVTGDRSSENRQEIVLFTPKGSLKRCRILTMIIGEPTIRERQEISSILATLRIRAYP